MSYQRMNNKKCFSIHSTVIFVSLSLLLPLVFLYAAPNEPLLESSIQIPQTLGIVEETQTGDVGKTIIYIQDAHNSLEAQENIARIIDYLVGRYGVKTVFEEGYEGPVPTDDFFDLTDDPEFKKRISSFLLDKLQLRAAEYAYVNRKKDFKLIGIGDIESHLRNIYWYREASRYQKMISKELENMEKVIRALADQYFPDRLKEWVKLRERFDRHQLSSLDYLRRVRDLSSHVISESDFSSLYPNIHLLLESKNTEGAKGLMRLKEISAYKLFQEVDNFEDELSKRVLQNDRDQKVFFYLKSLYRLKRLNEMTLMSVEFEIARDVGNPLETQDISNLIAKLQERPVVFSKGWEDVIENSISFYRAVKKRDGAAAGSHLLSFVKDPSEKLAILVLSGLRKDHMKEVLQRSGLSYYVVAPKVSEPDSVQQAQHKQLMSG